MGNNAIIGGKVYELGHGITYAQTQPAVAASSTLVVAANTRRSALSIDNISDTDVYLNFTGAAATVGAGYILKTGTGISFSIAQWDLMRCAIYGIHNSTGTKTLLVSDGSV